MAAADPITIQVRVDELSGFYSSLVRALAQGGLAASQLSEILSECVSGECVHCRATITGADMGQVALAAAAEGLAEPRLVRLRQGYCAGPDCSSYYYRITLREHPDVDWGLVRGRMREAASAPVVQPRGLPGWWRDKRVSRAALGFGVVVILLLCKHILSGGALPFLSKAPEYKIDPASVETSPR